MVVAAAAVVVVLGGVMVSVLPIETNVKGFKPGRGRWTFKDDKVCNTSSFGGKVKPSAPRRKIFWHIKFVCVV
jgi:hypothetical protein